MTSIYLPLFLGFFCAPFLGAAAPSKSSMLLALLILVAGRLGGRLGGPAPTSDPETDRLGPKGEGPSWADNPLPGPNGGAPELVTGLGGAPPPPPPPSAADLGADLGGGGVAFLTSTFSAPGFLLIHRLSSGSKTKLLASPSFARMGFPAVLGEGEASAMDSFFLPPPNQPPKPQPFFVDCLLAARMPSSA